MKKAIYFLILIFVLVLSGLVYDVHNPKAAIPIIDKITVIQSRWESWRNPLRNYGVSYSWDHGEHYEVTILTIRK